MCLFMITLSSVWLAYAPCAGNALPVRPDEDIVFFPTCGHFDDREQVWMIPIRGWIYELDKKSWWRSLSKMALLESLDLDAYAANVETFNKRADMFLVDNESDKNVRVRIGGESFKQHRSKANGHFERTLRLKELPEGVPPDGWLEYEADLPKGDSRKIIGRVQLASEYGLSVISDIDDTIKISDVKDLKALVANTFLKEFKAVPDMQAAYHRWSSAGACFHYVSSSPWQLYPPLLKFMGDVGYPEGTYHLKTFRIKDESFFDLFASHELTKVPTIDGILRAYPKRRFILVGDSTQKDPEVYGEIARRHPNQIVHIYIRRVSGAENSKSRFDAAFEGCDEGAWTITRDAQPLLRLKLPTGSVR